MLNEITSSDLLPDGYPISIIFTGSSRKEGSELKEILDWLFFSLTRQDLSINFSYLRECMPLFERDMSSVHPHLEITSETYETMILTDEEIVSDMLDHNYVVKMPPKKEYSIRLKIRSVEKAVPRVFKPEEL